MKKLFQRTKAILWPTLEKGVQRVVRANWEKIDNSLMRIFQISWRLGVLLVVCVMLLFIYRGLKDENYAIKAFLVPKELSDAGFSGVVVANKLFDEIKTIQEFVASQKEDLLNIQSEIKPDLKLDVMGFGLSVNSTIYYLKDLLGRENRFISGEVTDLSGELALTLRLTGHPTQLVVVKYEEGKKREALDSLMHEGAKAMLGLLDPYRLAVYYYKKDDDNLSLDLIREIIKGKPEEAAWGYLAWGNLLKKQGENAKACDKYRKATEVRPKFLLAWANWAWVMLQSSKFEKAIPLFEKAASLNPENSSYYNGLAICYRKLENHEKANAYYAKAVETQPEVIWWYGNWASYKFEELKDSVGAAEIMARAQKNIPESDEFYLSRGAYYFFTNRMDSAMISIDKALEMNPENIVALDQMGKALWQVKKDYDGAKKIMHKKIKLISRAPAKVEAPKQQLQDSYNFMATMEYEQEQYDSALIHIKQAIELDSTASYPYTTQAEIYGLQGNKEAFYQSVEKAVERGFDFKPYLIQKPYNQFAEDARFLELIGKE